MDAIEEHTGLTREEVELAGNLSPDERGLANLRSRRKFQTDYDSDLATAEDRGRRKGRAEGKAEGKAQGKTKGKAEVARNALRMNMTVNDIISLTGLSRGEAEKGKNTHF